MSASLPVAPSDTPMPVRGALPVLAAMLTAPAPADAAPAPPPAPPPAPSPVAPAVVQPIPASPAAAIDGAVKQAFAAFRERLDAGDYAGAVAHYADDPRFAWVEDGQVRYRSRGEVARAFEQLRAMGPVRYAYGEPTVAVLARDLALLIVPFETTVGEGAQRHAFGGTMTVTMLRGAPGWQFLLGHSSSRRARVGSR